MSWKWKDYYFNDDLGGLFVLEEDGAAIATIDMWSKGRDLHAFIYRVKTGKKEKLKDFPVGTSIESVKSFMETMARMEGWDG